MLFCCVAFAPVVSNAQVLDADHPVITGSERPNICQAFIGNPDGLWSLFVGVVLPFHGRYALTYNIFSNACKNNEILLTVSSYSIVFHHGRF